MGKKNEKRLAQIKGPKVSEATRIHFTQLLEQFRTAEDQAYTFEANLTNRERGAMHELCRKMGMKSKSSGQGNERRICVYKIQGRENMKKAPKKASKKLNTKGPKKTSGKVYTKDPKKTSGKVDNMKTLKRRESQTSLEFSKKSKEVLQDLFTNYPPKDEEFSTKQVGKRSEKARKLRRKKDDFFCKPLMEKVEILKQVEALTSRIETSKNLKEITEERSKLPVASFRDLITSTIESHQVVLICGETGCGKTTQVPQFLLDHVWGKDEACKIVCTQPRRISAISVAERISYERGETVGGNIGYKIRLESKGGRHSSIVFCTNGVLLRVLVANSTNLSKKEASNKPASDDVSNITHVIMDEIHERDHFSDFMLAILRDMLSSYSHLRLILMSATLDAERFSQYFGGCPIICIPGFTYPVKTLYLEDVLSILKSPDNNNLDSAMPRGRNEGCVLNEEDKAALDEAINLAWSNDEFDALLDLVSNEGTPEVYNYQHSSTGFTPLMVFSGKGRVADVCMLLTLGADCSLQASDGITALELAERQNEHETADIIKRYNEIALPEMKEQQQLLDKYLTTINTELIDTVLIEQLLMKICIDSKDGGILVFLPGWDDINRTRERLLANQFFKDASKFVIISLHSMVPSADQRKVFNRPPLGCRKIILSTNIAESSITIDDVVYVIDSGRMKEKSYDPYCNVSTLQSSWISKASARQREGRAGRCQPGICYHLYSRLQAASLPDFQVPEIKRMPIEELCLQVKLLNPSFKIEDYLRKTMDPPLSEAIRNAIVVLQDIGALSLNEELTELGEKLGCLPVHPLTSKMLFFGILMNCLGPALTLACASDYKDPFTIPVLPNEKMRATAAKIELASFYGGHGDHLAIIAAFDCWKNAKKRGQEAQFCSRFFVSPQTMNMLDRMRQQLQNELNRYGFIPEDESDCNLNANDPGIIHAVLVAGFYPMVGRLLPPKNGKRDVVETDTGTKVFLHPHSISSKSSFRKVNNDPLIIYGEIIRGDGGLHIRNCNFIGPFPLLLLAIEIVVASAKDVDDQNDHSDDGSDEDAMDTDNKLVRQLGGKILSFPENSVTVVVDRWLYFRSTAIDLAQICCLRERLSAAILFKVTHPNKVLPPVLGASVFATACILSFDGLSGILLPRKKTHEQAAFEGNKESVESASEFLKSLIVP